jgi:hypothetical protein
LYWASSLLGSRVWGFGIWGLGFGINLLPKDSAWHCERRPRKKMRSCRVPGTRAREACPDPAAQAPHPPPPGTQRPHAPCLLHSCTPLENPPLVAAGEGGRPSARRASAKQGRCVLGPNNTRRAVSLPMGGQSRIYLPANPPIAVVRNGGGSGGFWSRDIPTSF